MLKKGQSIDKDNLNMAFLSRLKTGMQVFLGSLRIRKNLQLDGDMDAFFLKNTSDLSWKKMNVTMGNVVWNRAGYANGLYFLFGYTNSGATPTSSLVASSTDGLNWNQVTLPAGFVSPEAVTYGNGLYAICASNGTGSDIITSPDGVNWTIRATPNGVGYHDICFGNGIFLAVSDWGVTNGIYRSTDGINWTAITTDATLDPWWSVAYGNGKFVFVSDYGIAQGIAYSTDGTSWTRVNTPDTTSWECVTFGNGRFVAVGTIFGSTKHFATSTDGVNWTFVDSNNSNYNFNDVAFGNGLFVAVSGDRFSNHRESITKVAVSSDGTNWTYMQSTFDGYAWRGIAFGNGKFIAVSSGDGNGNPQPGNDLMYSTKLVDKRLMEETKTAGQFGLNSFNTGLNAAAFANSNAEGLYNVATNSPYVNTISSFDAVNKTVTLVNSPIGLSTNTEVIIKLDGNTYLIDRVTNISGSVITLAYNTPATGWAYLIAYGNNTDAGSHAEGYNTTAGGKGAHAEGYGTMAMGNGAHSEGFASKATQDGSHAEGYGTSAGGYYSHTEGYFASTTASYAHAEGYYGSATGIASHAEGYQTHAQGDNGSHAEGYGTTASGYSSHAEGYNTTASNDEAHAEGQGTNASGINSHAEGRNTIASGLTSHAQGDTTTASGACSHTEGSNTTASGSYSHAQGYYTSTNALDYSHIMGKYGDATDAGAWHLANGTGPSAKGLAAKILPTGAMYADGAYNGTGADYAELFEWLDSNTNNEDRVGYFVTLDGEKIRKATSSDTYILGIVSATPSIMGDSAGLRWQGKYMTDEWGRIQYQMVDIPEQTEVRHYDAVYSGDTLIKEAYDQTIVLVEAHQERQPILNPDWNNDQPYVERIARPEWDAIGLMGKLFVRDDGTCQVNSFCKSNDDGIAVPSTTPNDGVSYRVTKRVSTNIIQVLVK